MMCDLHDGTSVGGTELLAESGVCDLEVAPDVEGVFLSREEREALGRALAQRDREK
jgi:hypothetical protein